MTSARSSRHQLIINTAGPHSTHILTYGWPGRSAGTAAEMGGPRADLGLLRRQRNPRTAGDGAQIAKDVVVADIEVAECRVCDQPRRHI